MYVCRKRSRRRSCLPRGGAPRALGPPPRRPRSGPRPAGRGHGGFARRRERVAGVAIRERSRSAGDAHRPRRGLAGLKEGMEETRSPLSPAASDRSLSAGEQFWTARETAHGAGSGRLAGGLRALAALALLGVNRPVLPSLTLGTAVRCRGADLSGPGSSRAYFRFPQAGSCWRWPQLFPAGPNERIRPTADQRGFTVTMLANGTLRKWIGRENG
jgi:hypothetical protein